MQAFPRYRNDETAFVTIHLSNEEYQDLRSWMHTDAQGQEHVTFPHQVKLFKRGFGWYRLDVSNSFRAIEKLKTAMAIVRKWHHELERRRTQEIQLLMAKAVGHRVQSYHSDSQSFRIQNVHNGQIQAIPLPRKPVSVSKLQQLVAKFGAR